MTDRAGETVSRLRGWMRAGCAGDFSTYPAMPAALFAVFGILTAILPFYFGVSGIAFAAATLAAACFLAFFITGRRRYAAFCCPLGAAWALLFIAAPWQTYRKWLPRDACSAVELRARVVDCGSLQSRPAWLGQRDAVLAEVIAVKTVTHPQWSLGRGRVLLRSKDGPELEHGAIVEASGVLIRPSGRQVPDGFDYQQYLRLSGVRHILWVRELAVTSGPVIWRRPIAWLYRLRLRWGERLVAQLGDGENARIAAAMTLGYKEGLTPGIKSGFRRGGAVHMFAISGLHVGIAMSILLWLFRFCHVPYRWRYMLLPLLLGLYVFMTGAAPSAVRAWVMLSLWACAIVVWRPASPLNVISVAALLLMILNPLVVLQAGFQFSFLIVTALVLAWPAIRNLEQVWNCTRYWQPRVVCAWPRQAIRRFGLRSVQAAGATLVAWTASVGLVAGLNFFITPAALFVNVLVCLLAWLALAVAALKLMLAQLPGAFADPFIGAVLGTVLNGIRLVVATGNRSLSVVAIAKPPVLIILTCCALALIAAGRGGHWRVAAGAGLALMLTALPVWSRVHRPVGVSLVCSGGGTTPAIVIEPSRHALAPALLASGWEWTDRSAVEYLAPRGHAEIECVMIPGGDASAATDAVTALRQFCPVRYAVIEAPGTADSGEAAAAVALKYWLVEGRDRVWYLQDGLHQWQVTQSREKKRALQVRYAMRYADRNGCDILVMEDRRRGRQVHVRTADGDLQEFVMPFRLRPEVVEVTTSGRIRQWRWQQWREKGPHRLSKRGEATCKGPENTQMKYKLLWL